MWLRDKKCAFEAPEFSKFPVKFPVSREFGQRKVSARLPAPPNSLRLGEFGANSPPNFAETAVTSTIPLKTKLKRASSLTPSASLLRVFSLDVIASV